MANRELYVGLMSGTSLDGIDALTFVDRLMVENCPKLASVAALENTTIGRWLDFINDPLLTSIDGLQGAADLMRVGIGGTGLTTLQGLSFVQRLDVLLVFENPSLTSLRALDGLQQIGHLNVSDNPVLPSCEVDWLRANATVGELVVGGNDDSGVCPP